MVAVFPGLLLASQQVLLSDCQEKLFHRLDIEDLGTSMLSLIGE